MFQNFETQNTVSTSLPDDLLEFIPAATPRWTAPHHLKPLTDAFERIAKGEQLKLLVSTPPQHGKSQTCLHALVWLLKKAPQLRHAYATYAQAFTRDQSYEADGMASRAGLNLDKSTQDRWTTPEGGAVTWTSRGGPLSGRPVDGLLLIDDLIKDYEEAASITIRNRAMNWLESTAFTRMHPSASVIIVATRWHPDDPHGRLLKRGGWEYIELPAITSEGEALWPEMRPLEWLMEVKANTTARIWEALYMCNPQPDGLRVFNDAGVQLYDKLPDGPYREAHGFDAAYTPGGGDYTVIITGRLIKDKIYITKMVRRQVGPDSIIPLVASYGARELAWRRSSTEKGLVLALKREKVRVREYEAHTSKISFAATLITEWHRGNILLPANSEIAPIIEAELLSFTGQDDPHDDIVDAMAALVEHLVGSKRSKITSASTADRLYR